MTIVSKTMTIVSKTMAVVSQTMTIVSQTGVSVSVVRISLSISLSFRLSLSLPLVQSVDGLERVSSRVELADSVSVSEVPQTMDIVETKTNSVSNHDTGFSIGTPLAPEALRRPGHKGSGDSWMESNTKSVSVSVERSSQVSVSVVRISLGFSTSLADNVDSSHQRTAAIAGGIQTQSPCSGPCGRYTSGTYQGIGVHGGDYKVPSISLSFRGGQGGNSQAGGNQ